MSKVTVGFCKSKGIEFVEGDKWVNKWNDAVCEMSSGSAAEFNFELNAELDDRVVSEFAWRENTGEQPCDDDVIVEVELTSGVVVVCRAGEIVTWQKEEDEDTYGKVRSRPHLSSLQKEFEEMNSNQEAVMSKEDEEWELKDKELNQVGTAKQQYTSLSDFGKRVDDDIDIDSIRRERDIHKERASDLESQLDKAEMTLKHYKISEESSQGAIEALKECLRLKELECAELVKDRERESETVEWDGDGLPPVGCECEYDGRCVSYLNPLSKWRDGDKLKVVFHAAYIGNDGELSPMCHNQRTDDFCTVREDLLRPIESPEQKEAREREENGMAIYKVICEMEERNEISGQPNAWSELRDDWQEVYKDLAQEIGYRKQ